MKNCNICNSEIIKGKKYLICSNCEREFIEYSETRIVEVFRTNFAERPKFVYTWDLNKRIEIYENYLKFIVKKMLKNLLIKLF